jgi:hypothetical protein
MDFQNDIYATFSELLSISLQNCKQMTSHTKYHRIERNLVAIAFGALILMMFYFAATKGSQSHTKNHNQCDNCDPQ